MDTQQFREFIVRPTLKMMNDYIPRIWSQAAENLLVGTALVESDLVYLHQKNGPSLGLYQINPSTERDIMDRYIKESRFKKELDIMFKLLYNTNRDINQLVYDLRYATIIARLRYFKLFASPFPDAENIHALGHYWNDHYNANPGVDTADEFELKYRKAHAN